MLLNLIQLEIKAIFRSKQLKTEVVTFLFKFLFAIYIAFTLLGFAFLAPKFIKENYPGQDVFFVISGFFVFYWLYDLFLRYMFLSSPVVAIKPLLIINIKHKTIVNYTVAKAYFRLYNVLHLFFFLPLTFILIHEGYTATSVVLWACSMLLILSCNSFISIFLEKINLFFYLFVGLLTLIGMAHFYGWINVLPFTSPISSFFYYYKFAILIAVLLVIILGGLVYAYYNNQLYLDKGLRKKENEVKSLNFKFLSNLGVIGVLIKNDLYLIVRNKRPRTTILMSFLFVFYPFLMLRFFQDLNQTAVLVAVLASGGFMMSFGQFVPSWDSTYYPLLMTNYISYRDYLLSKWYIMAFGCLVTLFICSFYLYFSSAFFWVLVAITIFNIGVNSFLTLLIGIFMLQPINLTSNAGAFGNTKSFNINTLVLSIVMIVLPILIQVVFQLLFNFYVGLLAIAAAGCFGILFRNKILKTIEKKYSEKKYKALQEFKN